MDFTYLSLTFLLLMAGILGVAGYDISRGKKYYQTPYPLERSSRYRE